MEMYDNTAGPVMKTLYVSPGGSDNNPGTEELPLATLNGARGIVRGICGNMTGNICVNLASGVYKAEQALTLTQEDSGTNGYKVIYRGPSDMSAVLSGGVSVRGWQPAPERGKGVYKAKIEGVTGFRQFYVNGKPRTRARNAAGEPILGSWYLHNGFYNPLEPISIDAKNQEAYKREDIPESVRYGILVNTRDLPKTQYEHIEDIEFVLYRDWVTERAKVREIIRLNDNETVISLDYTQGEAMFYVPSPPKRSGEQPYYLENAIEFLDEPGEWFFDKHTSTLYYIPAEGEDIISADAVIPAQIETLIDICGTKERRAHDIVIKNLTLEYTTWLVPDTKGTPSDIQGNQFSYTPQDLKARTFGHPTAVININHADDITVERCVICRGGGNGIAVLRETDNVNINGNCIFTMAASGISAGTERGSVSGLRITNNNIKDTARDYCGACGVLAMIVKDTVIEHNEISYAPYTGISVGWGWNDNQGYMENNLVRYNDIHHVMQLLFDGGCIYTLGSQLGSQIAYNYTHDMTWGRYVPLFPIEEDSEARAYVWGVYLDAMTSFMSVHDNYVERFTYMKNLTWNKHPYPAFENGNKAGNDNTGYTADASVKQSAGVESAYRDMEKYLG